MPTPSPAADRPLGSKDPVAVRLRELARQAGRRAHGQFVAEGPTIVRRALADRLAVDAVVATTRFLNDPECGSILASAAAAHVPARSATEAVMGTLTTTRPLPGMVAVVRLDVSRQPEVGPDVGGPVLVAEGIQNPDNLGMILRTAEAAGAALVVTGGSGVDPLHKNCVRAARGAVGRLRLFDCPDIPSWLRGVRDRGLAVLATSGRATTSLYECSLRTPVAFVVGNEATGLGPETLAVATEVVRIPMAPGQDSLNVGVAAGIVLYEWRRQHAKGS